MSKFKFKFSLTVLNTLGRGLYRNFATVVAEAVSNSWDAEATRVDIHIDVAKKSMSIEDNGKGMDATDFRDKFLKVGYSRRDDASNKSRRKVFGRKGIGKLAMLSISDRVKIASKKKDSAEVNGGIDNSELDEKIKNDRKYSLKVANKKYFKKRETGTKIYFEGIKDTVNNPEIIKKYMAVIFNFSFSFKSEAFDIYVNNKKVGVSDLKAFNESTQYLWAIDLKEMSVKNLIKRFDINNPKHNESKYPKKHEEMYSFSFHVKGKEYFIKGFVASVNIPRNLKFHGSGGDFSAGLHLFVNGRLRQEHVFRDIPSHRIIESYLYGEIHVDGFDDGGGDGDDIFTSSREGILKDSAEYGKFLKELRKIQSAVFKDWEEWRSEASKKKIRKIFHGLKPNIQKAVDIYTKSKPEDDGKFIEFLNSVTPALSGKLILICHSSKDKKLADVVYDKLRKKGFKPKEIIYTASRNVNSKLPVTEKDIFEYIRKFFVQNWYHNPHVIFVVSSDFESSWLAATEAGAAWVTRTDYHLTVADGHKPRDPLNARQTYIQFDKSGKFANRVDANSIFSEIAKKYGK